MDPEQFITGEWKSFTFHVITPEDCARIVQHLGEHFIPEEIINRHIGGGLWDEDRMADTTARINYLLGDRLSFYVKPKDSNKIIAINLISDSRRPPPFSATPPRSEVTRRIRAVITHLEGEAETIFESRFKCDFYADIFMTSVHREYNGQGIGTELYERSLKFLKAKGFPVVKADFSHPGTQRIGRKLGFEEVHKFYLKDAVDHNGAKIFPDAKEHEYVVNVAKWL